MKAQPTFTLLYRDNTTGQIAEGKTTPDRPTERYPFKEYCTVSTTTWDLIVKHQPQGRVLHVYAAIMRSLKPADLRIYITQSAIAKDLDMQRSEVGKAFAKLRDLGLIHRRQPPREAAYWIVNKDHCAKGSARQARQLANDQHAT